MSTGPSRQWQERQALMDAWYADLKADHAAAIEQLVFDYEPYVEVLRTISGDVIDVGGGAGVAATFLERAERHVVVEPSTAWFEPGWAAVATGMGNVRRRPQFVRGVGEALPFRHGRFDAALALWTLNHAAEPARVVEEVHRVLKPGGRAFVILEDMEPDVADVLRHFGLMATHRIRPGQRPTAPRKPYGLKRLIRHKARGDAWPLQPDHVRITEVDLRAWLSGRFRLRDRSWHGGFLSYDLIRI